MTALGARRGAGLSGREPGDYIAHELHRDGGTYTETNCYTDVLIELLHGCGYEPLAALGHCVRLDFEGDQWTFFKPPPGDLEALYGIDIHEMQPYRPLPFQIAEQLAAGRTIIVELDAWHLPDTAATSYRSAHVKTSVAADAIDLDGERLCYFHNLGLHELAGEDFRGVFRVGAEPGGEVLPPYTELVRFDAGPALAGDALRARALALLGAHLERRPADNPFERFASALASELPALVQGGVEDYHAYAFATVRMAGAGFELLQAHVAWLLGAEARTATDALDAIVEGCKVLSFRLARRRPFEVWPLTAPLADAWRTAMEALARAVG